MQNFFNAFSYALQKMPPWGGILAGHVSLVSLARERHQKT